MPIYLILPLSMAVALLAWSLAFRWYAAPWLARQSFAEAMKPLLLLHAFRYIGLMFLIPGVTAIPLDPRFAWPAAYGDLLAAFLALAALLAISARSRITLSVIAVFNVVGLVDLLNAVARGLLFTPDGALGAAYWIPAFIVPLLIITHGYIFYRLWHYIRDKDGMLSSSECSTHESAGTSSGVRYL